MEAIQEINSAPYGREGVLKNGLPRISATGSSFFH